MADLEDDVIRLRFELDQAKERLAKLEDMVQELAELECAKYGSWVRVPVLEEWVQARRRERELKALVAARTSPSRPA